MLSWITIKSKLALLGAGLLTVLALFVRYQSVKNQRDRYKQQSEILRSRSVVEQNQKKIVREEKKKQVSRKAELVKELNKSKEEFKGLDNLNNPNDF